MECLRDTFTDGVILGGRYQTLAPLNHGSFGMVFMAKDLQTTDTVAIKVLTKKSAASEADLDFAVDDTSEELILHRRLSSHPNIVALTNSFETDAHVYLVLEFCPRGDLYEAIRNGHGPLETEHVRRFMLELVDAVEYIHSKGIYHRDIKPENIFLTQSGSMKLGDFGLATTEKWTLESTVGSDRYMSPEQYDSDGAGYSPAQADIWAVGICLLNILFSRNPFTAPTASDPLFLDFSRDKQSLFDVFPSMSQDTYEVIVQCMNLDPTRRSLVGARDALRRLVSFTTLEEALDDFDSAARRGLPSAHREPLRTPSIQSPQVDTGAFPWAKALQTTSPQAIRHLSAIPDNESYTEDLFSKSEETNWSAATADASSLSSVPESNLGASMMSLAINRAPKAERQVRKVSPMAGSLPITMSKPRQPSAMSMVFGRKEPMSKSWSDMWEEDEEEENERARQMQTQREFNPRAWSRDSKTPEVAAEDDDDTPRQGLSPTVRSSLLNMKANEVPSIERTIVDRFDGDPTGDGIFFDDIVTSSQEQERPLDPPKTLARYSPPPKRNPVDKWAALGEKRRAFTRGPGSSADKTPEPLPFKAGRQGYGFSSFGHGVWWDHSTPANHAQQANSSFTTDTHSHSTTPHHTATPIKRGGSHHNAIANTPASIHAKERAVVSKQSPWNKGRDWHLNWRREKRLDLVGDAEWVGGWGQEAHP